MSTLKVNTIQNASGVEVYTAKAWVNFNGTGTVAIRAAGNVASITDNGTGDYTLNFTTAMPNANYAYTCSGSEATRTTLIGANNSFRPTTTTLRLFCYTAANNTTNDVLDGCVAIFR